MNRLFNEYECENDAGRDLSNSVHSALKDIIDVYLKNEFSINDIEKVIVDEISLTLCEAKLLRNMKKRKENVANNCGANSSIGSQDYDVDSRFFNPK